MLFLTLPSQKEIKLVAFVVCPLKIVVVLSSQGVSSEVMCWSFLTFNYHIGYCDVLIRFHLVFLKNNVSFKS